MSSPQMQDRLSALRQALGETSRRIKAFDSKLATAIPTPPWTVGGGGGAAGAGLGELEQKIESLAEENDELQFETRRLQDMLTRATSRPADGGARDDELVRVRHEHEALKATLDSLQREHTDALSRLSGQASDVASNDAVIEALQAELRDAKAETDRLARENHILHEAISTAKDSETSGITEMQDLMQRQLLELDQLRESRRDLNALLEQTRGKLRDANEKRNRYKKLLAKREQEYDDLHRRYEKVLPEVEDLRAELKAMRRELATAEKRQEHLKQHIKRAR